jgi:hypothetical protein
VRAAAKCNAFIVVVNTVSNVIALAVQSAVSAALSHVALTIRHTLR